MNKHLVRATTLAVSLMMMTLSAQANDTLDEASEGISNLFEKAKNMAVDVSDSVVEKSSEIGGQVSEKASESGTILWDKAKKVGQGAADLAEQGMDRIKSDECDPLISVCEKEE